jgi:hypothetical protein
LPDVVDYDGDGNLDVIGLDVESNIVVYLGNGDCDLTAVRRLHYADGRPVCSAIGIRSPDIGNSRSGRTGIAAVDWEA